MFSATMTHLFIIAGECKELDDVAGRCWLFVRDALTWPQASQTCIGLGGHLAVEYDTDIQYSLAREAAQRGGTWWIGLRRSFQADLLQGKQTFAVNCKTFALSASFRFNFKQSKYPENIPFLCDKNYHRSLRNWNCSML